MKLKKKQIILYLLLFTLSFAVGLFLTKFPAKSIQITNHTENEEYIPTGDEIVNGKININTASEATLMELNGIGEKLSARIVAYRTKNGKFTSIENLMDIPGIGTDVYNNIKDLICAD